MTKCVMTKGTLPHFDREEMEEAGSKHHGLQFGFTLLQGKRKK